MLPCIIREVYYFLLCVLIVLVGQCITVFMRVLIVLVGQLYQDHGVSGVQGWAVGF